MSTRHLFTDMRLRMTEDEVEEWKCLVLRKVPNGWYGFEDDENEEMVRTCLNRKIKNTKSKMKERREAQSLEQENEDPET